MPNNRCLRSAEHTRGQQGDAETATNFKTRSAHAGQDNGRPELTVHLQMYYVSPRASQGVPTRKPTLIMRHLVGCRVLSVGRMGLGNQWAAPCYLDQLRARPGTAQGRILVAAYILSVAPTVHAYLQPMSDLRHKTRRTGHTTWYPWRCEARVIPRPP